MSGALAGGENGAALDPGRGEAADDAREALRVWLRLLSCTNRIESEIRGRLRERFGTTLPRFDLLAQLDAAAREGEEGLTMMALSRRLMVTNGNVTSLIERLAREGLVRRGVVPGDRRVQLVRLTAAGRKALQAMTPDHQRWIEAMFAGLTPDERTQLHALVGKLKASVDRPTDSHADPLQEEAMR